MTDGPALLRKINENPAEDMPRLAYADWLDEHAESVDCGRCKGNGRDYSTHPHSFWANDCHKCSGTGRVSNGYAERAEFIRLQCELAKNPSCVTTVGYPADYICDRAKLWGCARCLLKLRERELRRTNAPQWYTFGRYLAVSVWDHFPLIRWAIIRWSTPHAEVCVLTGSDCRGFVDEIHVASDILTEDFARAVWSRHPVRKVVVTDAAVWPSGGNNTYYIGGLDQYPRKYWRRLDGLPSAKAARDALSDVIVAWGRELAGLSPLVSVTV